MKDDVSEMKQDISKLKKILNNSRFSSIDIDDTKIGLVLLPVSRCKITQKKIM